MKHKTLIILPDLRIGGAEKNSVLIANELYSKGMDVVFVIKNDLNSYSFMLNPKIKIISLKVKRLRKMINDKGLNTHIEIDGGVNINNAKKLIDAGADVLVAGSFVFKSDNPSKMITDLKSI